MKCSERRPVRFVDDGYPEAREYANNYQRLPVKRRLREHRTTTVRAVLRLLRRRLRQATGSRRHDGAAHVGSLA